jgi:hypothetical protein
VVPLDKRGTFQQIQRQVPADAKFRENNQIGPAPFRLRRQFQNPRRITGKISHSGIELSQGYLHSGRALE